VSGVQLLLRHLRAVARTHVSAVGAIKCGMDPLPMAPSCGLDEAGLRLQLERYRQVGQGGRLVSRIGRRLVVDLDDHVDTKLVEETIATERECCPFFDLGWEPHLRRLTVSVAQAEHGPALDAIAFALLAARR
jgi:hypothetical protein